MKIVIAGSRDFNDYDRMVKVLSMVNEVDEDTEIVSGGASGADSLGERYARNNELRMSRFPAKWKKFGKKAGILRNTQMAEYCDGLIAFWDGESHGTKHMIEEIKRMGKPYIVANYTIGKITEYNGFTFRRGNNVPEQVD